MEYPQNSTSGLICQSAHTTRSISTEIESHLLFHDHIPQRIAQRMIFAFEFKRGSRVTCAG